MAYLNGLVSAISQPKGLWVNVINSFESATKNYVLAIILLTLVIKLAWSVVESLQTWSQQKQAKIQALMQPEMEMIKQKYANQPQILQQKQNEVQRKYMGKGMVGSCLIMLLIMGLNIFIFFTFFSSLNAMGAYRSGTNYENLKYSYVNSINLVDKAYTDSVLTDDILKTDYQNLKIQMIDNEMKLYNGETLLFSTPVVSAEDFTTKENVLDENEQPKLDEEGNPITIDVTNKNIITLIQTYFPVDEEGKYDATKDVILEYEEDGETVKLYRSQAIQIVAMGYVGEVYDETKDSFLWIENIWVADSPMNNSIPSYSAIVSQIGAKNLEENEGVVYNAFMPSLKASKGRVNGFFILPLLCVLTIFATGEVNQAYNRARNRKKGLPPPPKQGKARFIMPLIIGVFALLYNSVFAMYMLVGQIVSMIVLVPRLMIVDKIIDVTEKKKLAKEKENTNIVDYTRKF